MNEREYKYECMNSIRLYSRKYFNFTDLNLFIIIIIISRN